MVPSHPAEPGKLTSLWLPCTGDFGGPAEEPKVPIVTGKSRGCGAPVP